MAQNFSMGCLSAILRWVNMNMPEKVFWKNLNIFFVNITIVYGFFNLFFS
jgi:hypothetical protein